MWFSYKGIVIKFKCCFPVDFFHRSFSVSVYFLYVYISEIVFFNLQCSDVLGISACKFGCCTISRNFHELFVQHSVEPLLEWPHPSTVEDSLRYVLLVAAILGGPNLVWRRLWMTNGSFQSCSGMVSRVADASTGSAGWFLLGAGRVHGV